METRREQKLVWDDEGFCRRVQQAASERGLNVEEVLREVGCAHDYLYRPSPRGRTSNVIMLIAEQLGVSPAKLAGWD